MKVQNSYKTSSLPHVKNGFLNYHVITSARYNKCINTKKKKKFKKTKKKDKIKIQTIFSYLKLPYIECCFILFLLKRLVTLSIKKCFFLFIFVGLFLVNKLVDLFYRLLA